ncbi:DUF305 domain-containing protein [Lysobacter terrae]
MQSRPLPKAALLAACLYLFSSSNFAAPPVPEGASPHSEEAEFLVENAAAMDHMMAAMDVKPTGDVDRDFVAMMAPHHQGAIDMAQAVLRYGKNEQIRRLAQEIIVTQQQEIAAMQMAIGAPLPASSPAPTQPANSIPHDH